MPKHFFTSDLHFGHGNIMKYSHRTLWMTERERELLDKLGDGRNYDFKVDWDSVRAMNEGLIENINASVGEDDVLWHLGDWCFAPREGYYNSARAYRAKIRCKNVHHIWGNHDQRVIADLFDISSPLLMVAIAPDGTYWVDDDIGKLPGGSQRIVLCHYAMLIWEGSHKGNWHLYGHSHSSLEEFVAKKLPGRKAFDVGVDNAMKIVGGYRPLSFDEVAEIMATRHGSEIDHHKDTR